jgi:hypothetical protein
LKRVDEKRRARRDKQGRGGEGRERVRTDTQDLNNVWMAAIHMYLDLVPEFMNEGK